MGTESVGREKAGSRFWSHGKSGLELGLEEELEHSEFPADDRFDV